MSETPSNASRGKKLVRRQLLLFSNLCKHYSIRRRFGWRRCSRFSLTCSVSSLDNGFSMSDSEEWKFRPFRRVPKLIWLVFRGQLSIWDIDGDLKAGEVASARPARAIIRSHMLLAGFTHRSAGSGHRDRNTCRYWHC
jgi:hypothetical protein